jgi:hypothetical protein
MDGRAAVPVSTIRPNLLTGCLVKAHRCPAARWFCRSVTARLSSVVRITAAESMSDVEAGCVEYV